MKALLTSILLIITLTAGEEQAHVKVSPPIIDLTNLTYEFLASGLLDVKLYRELKDAFQNHGVFIGINHPVTAYHQKSAFQAAHCLFSLPEEEKKELSFTIDEHFGRGYLPFGVESGLASIFEPKEGYSYGHPENTAANASSWLQSPNIWPSSLTSQELKIPFNTLFTEFSNLAELLLMFFYHHRRVLEGKITNVMIAGGAKISLLRLFHYFPKNSPLVQAHLSEDDKGKLSGKNSSGNSINRLLYGSSPHTDWGLLTIILQSNSLTDSLLQQDQSQQLTQTPGGSQQDQNQQRQDQQDQLAALQYYHRASQQWVDVPAIPGSLVFNLGDYCALVMKEGEDDEEDGDGKDGRVKEKEYISPIHRVLLPEEKERTSFVYFFYPHYDSPVILPVIEEKRKEEVKVKGQGQVAVDGSITKDNEGEEGSYNTLLSISSHNDDTVSQGGQLMQREKKKDSNKKENKKKKKPKIEKFGDYILKKWQGVYRG